MAPVKFLRQSPQIFLAFALVVPAASPAQEVLEEIIVTADYRERAVADLPTVISILDQRTINEVAAQHFEELIQLVPNLNWSGDGHRARYFQIRGVGELAQYQEWSHDRSLDWHLLEHASHRGVQNVVRDLNKLYRKTPALYELDFSDSGFEWIEWSDRDNSILSWIRRDKSGEFVICITNFTPVVRNNYRIGVPQAGSYRELLNTDAQRYGGSGISNPAMTAEPVASHDRPHSLSLALPALATLILESAQPAAGN